MHAFHKLHDKNVQPITDASEALAVLKVLLELEKINGK